MNIKYLPVCPSRVWFIDRLLGAASPLTFASFPVLCKKTVFLSLEIKSTSTGNANVVIIKTHLGNYNNPFVKTERNCKRFFVSTKQPNQAQMRTRFSAEC